MVTLPCDQSQLAGWNVPQGFFYWINNVTIKSQFQTGLCNRKSNPTLRNQRKKAQGYFKMVRSGQEGYWLI